MAQRALFNTAEILYPEVSSIQVQREDESSLDQSTLDELDDAGFRTYSKSARLLIENHYEDRKSGNTIPSNAEIKQDIVDTVAGLMDDGLVISEIERRPLKSDLDRALGTPAHWIAEFPELAKNEEIGFDIIVGNPPYGDILDNHEKALVGGYTTGDINEVAAQFVERQLDLLDENGYFGNVTTLRLVYQSTIHEVHETLRENLDKSQIACFAKRPDHIFENAQVRAAIISGRKDTEDEGDIVTSEFIRFSPEDRSQRLSNVDYHPVDGLLLGDTIGFPTDTYSILPKVAVLNSGAGRGGRNLSRCIRGCYQGFQNRSRFTSAQRPLFNTAPKVGNETIASILNKLTQLCTLK